MAAQWRRLVVHVGLGLLVAGSMAACERALVIPSGAQTVHATVTRDSVRLEPATVHEGMVYLAVDSDGTELMFIAGGDAGGDGGSDNPPGLSDEQFDAVVHGDLMSMYIVSGFRSGGVLGNTSELGELTAGKYLFLTDGIVTLEPGAYDSIPLDAFAVLEVVP